MFCDHYFLKITTYDPLKTVFPLVSILRLRYKKNVTNFETHFFQRLHCIKRNSFKIILRQLIDPKSRW